MVHITAEMVKVLRERTGAPILACKKALQEAEGNVENAVVLLRKAGEAKAGSRAGRIAAEGMIVIEAHPDGRSAYMVEINSETDFVSRHPDFMHFAQLVAKTALTHGAVDLTQLLSLPVSISSEQEAELTVEAARQLLIQKMGENIQIRRVACVRAPSGGVVGHYAHRHRIGVLVSVDQKQPELAKNIAVHIAALRPMAIRPADVSREFTDKERDIYVAEATATGKPPAIVEKIVDGKMQKLLQDVTLLGQVYLKNSELTVGEFLKQEKTTVVEFLRFEVAEGIEKTTEDFATTVMDAVKGKTRG